MGVYSRLGGKDGLVEALLIKGFTRLTAAIESGGEPDLRERLRSCGLRYRAFALDNRHFYAIMFEGDIPREQDSADVEQHARATFDALVRNVELAAAAGVLDVTNAFEAAQQIRSTVHGAVTLELKGLVLTPDPDATYQALIDTFIRGLAPR
jgi:AcrR family transcriptional regulator